MSSNDGRRKKDKLEMLVGIDTSNYTTSVALVSADGEVITDLRMALEVKPGERGLRQSDACDMHIENLAKITELNAANVTTGILGLAVSDKPRPIEKSYMPVFLAGYRKAAEIAELLKVPLYTFSHQEGHLRAAVVNTDIKYSDRFLAWHISGGTSELLLIDDKRVKLIGGSKDISFGQLLDRVGIALGFQFPCGSALDELAQKFKSASNSRNSSPSSLKKIAIKGLHYNLSGIETQSLRYIAGMDDAERDMLIYELFCKIGDALIEMTKRAAIEYGINRVLFTGGVAASGFLREYLNSSKAPEGSGTLDRVECIFGDRSLSSDNAVGIALLGADELRKGRTK